MRRVLTTFGFGESCAPLLSLSSPTFAVYAERHGYDFFMPSPGFFARWNEILDGRGASWLKVLLIRDLLKSHDEVLWLDSDVAVVRFDKDIADDLSQAPMHMVVHETPDGRVPNCGVWYVRRQADETLAKLWPHNAFAKSDGWWEQAALIHVLGGNPDAIPADTPPGPLWGELPYEWNPHCRDRRGIGQSARFFHATQFHDRYGAMLLARTAIHD